MSFSEQNNLRFFQFDIFPNEKINHGVFSRLGGVSPDSFSSLNVGQSAGDSRENVIENRRRIFEVFNKQLTTTFDVWQIHSDHVVFTEKPRQSDEKHIQADAIVTNSKDVSLFMQFADCVPILVYDPIENIVGIIHAGWKGTVNRITQKTISFMQEKFTCDPANILAGIGPSIGPDHYEVGNNVIDEIEKKLGEFYSEVLEERNGKYYFNLWESNNLLLKQAGVHQIEIAEICTACNVDQWYSYRLEGQKSGRFGVFLGLK